MSSTDRFAPKVRVALDPPKDTKYTPAQLAEYNGIDKPSLYVAIKGTIFDVTRNGDSYGPGKGYHVFVGRDASRALAKSSLQEADAVPDWEDLSPKEKKVLDDWFRFFSLRYSIVGYVDF